MGRYRAPVPKGLPYITSEGYQQLEQELDALWRKRVDVTQALSAAAAEGDRSENAEYIYRKKELAGIDRRIRYLQKRLPELTQVNALPDNRDQVYFGAWVCLEDEQDAQRLVRIVGADEINMDSSYISVDAPLAKALLKQKTADTITVCAPGGENQYHILAIFYGEKPNFP